MTTCTLRRYTSAPGFTADFHRVRAFLLRLNHESLRYPNFPWGRWEWIFCRIHQDRSALDRIGVWEDAGEVVALATYEDQLGDAFFVVAPGYEGLKAEMFTFAEANLGSPTCFRAMIDDDDIEMQRIAHARGYCATQQTQPTSILHPDADLTWRLPEGYRVASIADEFDVLRYNRCLHYGFNHEGEPDTSEETIAWRWSEISGLHQNRAYNHVVVAPDGEYAAYCGMWYQPGEYAALVEPVCTQPAYRMTGCGRAAVLASAIACFEAGAKAVFVGSTQQFYFNIGFAPVYNTHHWEERRAK